MSKENLPRAAMVWKRLTACLTSLSFCMNKIKDERVNDLIDRSRWDIQVTLEELKKVLDGNEPPPKDPPDRHCYF
jgi:hypothetical protein